MFKKNLGAWGLSLVTLTLMCVPMLLSYDVKLAIGNKNTELIVKGLKANNEKYRVIVHKDSLFEIQHNFRKNIPMHK